MDEQEQIFWEMINFELGETLEYLKDKESVWQHLTDDNKTLIIQLVSNFKSPIWLDGNNAYLIGNIYKRAKTDDDGYKLKAVQMLQKIAKEFGYDIQIIEAIQLIEAYCC
jgi:hypothetical protein